MNSGEVALALCLPLGSSRLRTISYLCSQGKTFAIEAGRLGRLATTDRTIVASEPSSGAAASPGCRTPLHP